MKLSKNTLNLLRNFSSINNNILIRPGNTLMTVAANKTAFACAEIEESFPHQFGIYDLNEFLGVISIFNDPDLDFTDRALTISEGNRRIRYMPADPEVIIFPKKEPKFTDEPDASFTLDSQQLTQISKASSVLKAPIVTFKGDGSKIVVLVHDKTNPNSNQFTIDVGENTDKNFEMHLKVDSLKMQHAPGDSYEVLVSFAKIVKFIGDRKSYLVACETDSTSE